MPRQENGLKEHWFVARNQKAHGPWSIEQLQQLRQANKLTPRDKLLKSGTKNWIEAGEVRGLFPEASRKARAPRGTGRRPWVLAAVAAVVLLGLTMAGIALKPWSYDAESEAVPPASADQIKPATAARTTPEPAKTEVAKAPAKGAPSEPETSVSQAPAPEAPAPAKVQPASEPAKPEPAKPESPMPALGAPEAVAVASGAADFQTAVAPFLKQHCLRCHGAVKPKGDLRLDTLRGALTPKGGETEVWASILERLQSHEMPPKGEPAPDEKHLENVMYWVRTELRKVGKDDLTGAQAYPGKGNYVDHKLLFGAPSTAAPATPSRIWRISPYQYTDLMGRFKSRGKLTNPFGLTSERGFRDYAFRYTVGSAESQQLLLNAVELLTSRIHYGYGERTPWIVMARDKLPPTDAQVQAVVAGLFDEVLLRKPEADELQRYSVLLANSIKSLGNREGVIQGLAPIFVHPEVVFRLELGAGPRDQHGRVMLAPRELAFALALALTDKSPDTPLLQRAQNGQLAKRQAVHQEVERLLNDPAIAKPRILRFFQEYFGYDQAPEIFKDRQLVSNFNIHSLVEDTDHLVLYVLAKDKNVLHELLTTNQSFVHSNIIKRYLAETAKGIDLRTNPGNLYWLGKYYNLTPAEWRPEQPMTLPAAQRAGILTQPSWLIANSTNVDNHAIHRGKWIWENLLGGTIPDTPITVDAKFPDEPHNTLRERMRFTRETYCWACHQRMNPIGLTFEMFDHQGQYRTEEIVFVKKGTTAVKVGKPVNSSGEVLKSGDPALNRPAANAIELVQRLAESEHVHQVFVRHAFRYWLGRNETLDDAPTLQAAYKAYKDSDGSMKALITSLLTSDSFLYRRPPAKPNRP